MDDEELKGLLPASPPAFAEASAGKEATQDGAVEDAAPVVTGPERGADGKFVAKAADVPPPAAPPEPGHVPISAMLDEREKRQGLERQLAEIRARETPPEPPTRDQQLEAALYGQNLRASRRFAEREYGKDVIATVHDWAAARCDADPAFNSQMRSSEDPYEAAFQAYSREQVLAEVKPGELAAYRAWKQASAQAQTQQPTPAQPLPRSLATASGTGAAGAPHIPVGEGEAFAATIKG